MHVLVAEDDQVCRFLLKRVLQRIPGIGITEAEDGEAAWELLAAGLNPDLCIFDVLMPKLNGIDLLERIRADAALLDTRVVLCTTANDRASVVRAAKLKVTGYITKPLEAELIRREIINAQSAMRNTGPCPRDVCERLAIPRRTYDEYSRELLQHLKNVQASIESQRSAPDTCAQIANGAAGACLNLGFERMAATFQSLHRAFGQGADGGNPKVVDELLRSLAHQVTRETERLADCPQCCDKVC